MNRHPTLAPCGEMKPAYYSPASPEIADGDDQCEAVPYGYIYFDCGCVTRSDGQVKVCKE
jgi:hypothetical protein